MSTMPTQLKLNNPWLVAVWPGMGHVAISAGYYLMAKLGMYLLAEFSARELFEVEHVDVKDGLIHTGRLPRSRLFVWDDPQGQRDLIVFIGEAQPPVGKYAFCRQLIRHARELGVERVFTFAAMATDIHPSADARVFGAAVDQASLAELRSHKIEIIEEGRITGLNGVLLGAAAEAELRGACLLGEMPHIFAQLPFPKASLAVLEVFSSLSDIRVDLTELREQSKAVEQNLGQLLARVEEALEQEREQSGAGAGAEADEGFEAAEGDGDQDEEEEGGLSDEDRARIEELFAQATKDRSKTYELKRQLDQLGVFRDYEDRFLDLFERPHPKEP